MVGRVVEGAPRLGLLAIVALDPDFGQKSHESGGRGRSLSHRHLVCDLGI